jgi:hypothetical protein
VWFRDNIAAGVGEIHERKVQGGLTAADCERTDTALKFGDAPLKNRTCRVGDPAIAKTLNFQIKQGSAVIGAIESVCRGLIYRDSYSLGGWIGLIAAMDGNSFATHSNTSPD